MALAQPIPGRSQHERPPLWRDAAVLKWLIQISVMVVVIAVLWFLSRVASTNLAAKGFEVNFDWMSGPANFQLGEGIDTVPNTAGRALWAGMVNTLRMAGAGILLATALGIVVGLARLSSNWLANKIGSVFVETLRNIPVLVQIILWFFIISELGALRNADSPLGESGPIPGWLYISQKGISLPRVFYADGFYQFMALLLILAVPIYFVNRSLHAKRDREGGESIAGRVTLGLLLVAALIAWFANGIMSFLEVPLYAIEDAWRAIPQPLMQTVLMLIALGAAFEFVRRFLNSRRTPAGLAKLTDDDYFRMVFAVVLALAASVIVWIVWPGLSSWIINSGGDFWGWFGDKFGADVNDVTRGSRPIDAMRPTIGTGRFSNFGPTGLTMSVNFAAVFLGLVFYTASFVAEIVRGGILAVAKGQTEAAAALGLSRSQALRKVILPQAFRIVMPPLGNQYLNLTKNTSLAIAVGMTDIVQVGQSVFNKNNQFLAVFIIWGAFYLICSLTISVIVNYINGRLAIVER
ncbi:MAG: ABC transporter permease subunit [Acidimicrobiales bacterium]|nr:ABC transporter permease subunit [Acidimicrobiales bacterium]